MAERMSGPVKPPVIDLKAREAEENPPAAEPAAAGDDEAAAPAAEAAWPHETPTPPPPRPQARLAMPWSAISIAAGAGAVLGVVLTYLVANWIGLPRQTPGFADPSPAVSALSDRAAALDSRLAALEDGASATRTQIETVATDLRQSLAEGLAAIPAPPDIGAIETSLQALEARVAAIAAGASSADAAALGDNFARLDESVTALRAELAAAQSRIAEGDSRVAALSTALEATKEALAAQTRTLSGTDIGPAVKLPLIVSGLEAAFANGRSYAGELQNLTAILPQLVVPETIAANAGAGLPRPDAVAARFNAVLPDILSGRASASTGDWTQDALEWAQGLLAVRPAEEIEGDTPEAIVSRLEGAVSRNDFVAAAALLAQLPAPMRDAAGDVGTDIATLAEAETFVTALRSQALAAQNPAEPAT